jgi:hypothetical protein
MSTTMRLTIVYSIIWACVLMGPLVLHRATLVEAESVNASSLLAADWDTLKGYLKIERGKAMWYADLDDPDEKTTVSRLQRTFLMIDSDGKILERSHAADDLERSKPGMFEIAVRTVQQAQKPSSIKVTDRNGNPFLMFCGKLWDEAHQHQYYVLIGRSFRQPLPLRLLENWFFLIPLAFAISVSISTLMVRHCLASVG